MLIAATEKGICVANVPDYCQDDLRITYRR